MIPKECKRLAEVDFPIAEVSRHSAREKSIRHGHPSTLHLWWARRPLAACRAMLLALLLPDPCDEHCPPEFKEKAREALSKVRSVGPEDGALRKALLKFIADFANWDMSANRTFLEVSRALVRAAHGEEPPLVVDPFAGGGSIPLEALRIGCEAFASDLNPVACLILKVMLEDIPRHGPGLAEELRRVGKEIKEAAEKELAEFYPPDPSGARPIAYLWARTIRCESPNCGAEVPLMSFWLCKKANRRRALKFRIIRNEGKPPEVKFEIFEPESDGDVPKWSVSRAKATCLCCNIVLPPERVRAQLAAQRGGADVIFDDEGRRIGGARLLAVVTLRDDERGRHYRLPAEADYEAVWKAQQRLEEILNEWEKSGRQGLCPVPDEPTPAGGGSGAGRAFSVQKYGMLVFADLFTVRQKLGMVTLVKVLSGIQDEQRLSPSLQEILGIVVSRCADYNSAYARWAESGEFVGNTFGRQALGPSWNFCEPYLLSSESGGYPGALDWVVRVVERQGPAVTASGQVAIADARQSLLPESSCSVWFTDPPYYDAVPYADLSDYFYVWLKRALPQHSSLADPFDRGNFLTPKVQEIVQDEMKYYEGQKKDRGFFEQSMKRAFSQSRRVLQDNGIGSVVFAHKTTEGWEALLGGMIHGGWTITGSWPIATERPGRLRSQESAALATSIHLVCRPRPEDAPVGDWGDVLRELPRRIGDWMERLQTEGVRGADLIFACIGPALEIFSRYSKVETAEGDEVDLPTFLEKVWEVVGRNALGQILGTEEARARNAAAGALEEDARLTALFLWTLQATDGEGTRKSAEDDEELVGEEEEVAPRRGKGFSLIFDVVRRFAQPLGILLPDWEGRIIETKKGVVKLLPVSERAMQLFGSEGAQSVADRIERSPAEQAQMALFPGGLEEAAPRVRGRGRRRRGVDVSDEELRTRREATTLDRVHAAMLLQAGGRAHALRALLKAEQQRGPDFLRLANALSALYPKGSEEKRLLDAMLLAVPR